MVLKPAIAILKAYPANADLLSPIYPSTQRRVDRQPVFFSDSDCARYLNTFSVYAERRYISLHAYCLMTNHTHLFCGLSLHLIGCRILSSNA